MNHVIKVAMGEMKISSSPDVLQTLGVGSCLVIILYDPVACIGGMAHAILPSLPKNSTLSTSALRYVHESIKTMVIDMIQNGARKDRIIAKLIGAAHMFPLLGDSVHGIGAQNVEQAHTTLAEQNILIVGEETGGTAGRSVNFDLASGVCSVETHL